MQRIRPKRRQEQKKHTQCDSEQKSSTASTQSGCHKHSEASPVSQQMSRCMTASSKSGDAAVGMADALKK
jgi:hypothetical protein